MGMPPKGRQFGLGKREIAPADAAPAARQDCPGDPGGGAEAAAEMRACQRIASIRSRKRSICSEIRRRLVSAAQADEGGRVA